MRLIVFVLACICLASCQKQPQRVPVSGTVLIDGEPLTGGSIRFVADSGRPATSEIMSDGSFELSESSISMPSGNLGVYPGEYRVAVSAPQVIDEQSDEVRWLAPSKYADFRTSGVEVTIDGPRDDLAIELTWEGNEPVDEEGSSEDEEDAGGETLSAPSPQTEQEASSDK